MTTLAAKVMTVTAAISCQSERFAATRFKRGTECVAGSRLRGMPTGFGSPGVAQWRYA